MNRIKCLIIDDEPRSANVLEAYIGELDSLELTAVFHHALDALMYLHQHEVDLIFLDIMIPKVTGQAFFGLLPSRPKVILLGHRRHRWRPGEDPYIVSFLPKPILFEDFLDSVDSYLAGTPLAARRVHPPKAARATQQRGPFVYVFSADTTVKIYLNEILYVESVKNCVRFRTDDEDIIVYQGLASVEGRLAGKGFLRIHRSLLVAIDRITALNEKTVELGRHILPITGPFRAGVSRMIRARIARGDTAY